MLKRKKQARKSKPLKKTDRQQLVKHLLITLLAVFIFRLLSLIPVPYVDTSPLTRVGMFQFADILSGSALSKMTIMAFGISTYITASIIIQMLTSQFKSLYTIVSSPGGKEKMERWTLYLMVILTTLGSLTYTYASQVSAQELDTFFLKRGDWWVYLIIVAIHIAGSILAFLLGRWIEKKGVGNGLSILIFVNIVSSLPAIMSNIALVVRLGGFMNVLLWFAVMLVLIALAVLMNDTYRQAKIQHSTSMARGNTGFRERFDSLKFKLNLNGVMPLILASALIEGTNSLAIMFPQVAWLQKVKEFIRADSITFLVVMSVLIMLFSFFYTSISQNPYRTSEQLQTNRSTIVGVPSGKKTGDLLKKEFRWLSLVSGLFMTFLFLTPAIVSRFIGLQLLQSTSIVIMVGVAVELLSSYKEKVKLMRRG